MTEAATKLEQAIEQAASQYYRLVMLAGAPASGKTAEIGSVEIGRTLLLDGWGIHLSVRGGWVWNLWGRTCVVVHFKESGTLRIGTDDAENLVEFLRIKVRE